MKKIKFLLKNSLLFFLSFCVNTVFSADLYNNGPLINSPGSGVGGADESILQNISLGMSTLGHGHQVANNSHIADEFTIPAGEQWKIDNIIFYAYQTGSGTASTMTAVRFQIWDGPPNVSGSNIVFGDLTTNRLSNTTWSGIYRVTETTMGVTTNRPIMQNTATAGVTLNSGTYWIAWQTDGTLTSGPWAPPITITGATTTGNALQFFLSAYSLVRDLNTSTQQGFPFIIRGTNLVDTPIPTMSQWGLLLFALLILSLSAATLFRFNLITEGAISHQKSTNYIPFEEKTFFWFLKLILLALILIFAIAIMVGYQMMPFDIPGILLTAVLLAYLTHLITPKIKE